MAFEVGVNQAQAVAEIMKQQGFANVQKRSDLNGIDRVVFGTLNSL